MSRLAGIEVPDIRGQGGELYFGADTALLVKGWFAQSAETETAAAVPSHRRADSALLAVNDFLQARNSVGAGMLAHFDTNEASAHFVGYGRGRARAQKRIEH